MIVSILKGSTLATVLVCVASTVSADPNDWVNVDYIVQRKGAVDRSTTVNAQTSIINGASSTAKRGPWTVTNSKGVIPPSKDPHDYLSFAPYHWPNCQWCSKGSTHLVNPDDDSGSHSDTDSNEHPDSYDSDPYPDGGDMDETEPHDYNTEIENVEFALGVTGGYTSTFANSTLDAQSLPANSTMKDTLRMHLRMRKVSRMLVNVRDRDSSADALATTSTESATSLSADLGESWYYNSSDNLSSTQTTNISPSPFTTPDSDSPASATNTRLASSLGGQTSGVSTQAYDMSTLGPSPVAAVGYPDLPFSGSPLLPTIIPTGVWSSADGSSTTTQHVIDGTPRPAQAPVKTHKVSCTPSPTSHLAPSATWTTCPYVGRDGRVNPDVRMLNGPAAINSASQSILYNAIAYALQKTSAYSSAATSFIDTFFLTPETKMNPNMNFGQMVRGPGQAGQQGTFTGVLDMRGIVKIINGIMILKASSSPDWTVERDQRLAGWMAQYATWLQNSPLGRTSASRPNNHATFYVSQLIATRVLAGDVDGATAAVQNYFSRQFLDQVSASGEQPFEAVRTRPFHYRCFNLEAMITNAKIGDQLGLNLWKSKSKYGATIQTALDYTMNLNPKTEDVLEIVPHVASVAAAYGDPKGKYAAFMTKVLSNYKNKSFWLYDQTAALPSSPAAQTTRQRLETWVEHHSADGSTANFSAGVAQEVQPIAFSCPAVFDLAAEVEIDNGIFVTCDELKPFYEIPIPGDFDT